MITNKATGYTIQTDKFNAVVQLVQRQLPEVTSSDIEEYCLADWPEGQEHQAWLDSAFASEIANWVIEGLRNREEAS